jgi:hypothetical protein
MAWLAAKAKIILARGQKWFIFGAETLANK